MKKQEILNIAKDLILIAGKFSKVTLEKEKQKLLKIFQKYENQLKNDNTKYSETILSFLYDLKNDLESGRELNIDNLKTDEYLENYLLTKRELKYYNSLILKKYYRKIFDELNKKNLDNKKIDEFLEKFIKNYLENIKKINTQIIAKNLLIFTNFDRVIPKKYLANLYLFLKNDYQKQKVLELIKLGNLKILEVKKYAVGFYQKNNFNYKYIGFTNINGKSVLNENIVDCSKIGERTGFVKYEYEKIIRSL